MKVREDIVRALHCSASMGDRDCTGCPYLLEETLTEAVAEIVGSETWQTCGTDQMAMDAAEMLETDARTISALIEDRKYYMEKYEELESQVPRHNYVPPEGGAEDDEA